MPHAFNLAKLPTRAPAEFDKDDTLRELERIRQELVSWQDRLYAENRRGVLIILQGMDASGKDGVVRTVLPPLSWAVLRVSTPAGA